MKEEIKVPAMGESISEATIGTILKPTGTQVNADDEIIELETDKVNQVLYAPQSGTVTWNISPGDVVKIGQVLGFVDTEGKGQVVSAPKKEEPVKIEQPKKVETPPPASYEAPSKVSLRTTKDDYLAELSTGNIAPVPVEKPKAAGERETRKKMSKIRKIISTKLVDALQTTAMLTTFNEADMTNIMNLRDGVKEAFQKKHNVKLGFMSFFVTAVVSALKEFPEINAFIDGDEIVYHNYYDIGVAVGTDKGVIVPVLRNCDTMSFAEIEKSLEGLAKKAREGGLNPQDLQGGTFTITNGGVYGSLLSTPIINPPQSAILGMHKIMKRPVVVNDQIVIRQMMYLALSYDHRIVDGKEAVSFLVHVKNILEEPSRLLLEL